MPKPRSPDYPAIGLDEAIEKVRMIWTKDYQNKVPKRVIAEHMGYKGLNGGSLPVISALSKYGLLEGRGDETRVSDLAVAILAHDPGTPERAAAIKQAAWAPELFAELDAKFPGGRASDAALRSYLIVQKFIPSGADAAIRAYRDTKRLVEGEADVHTADLPTQQEPRPMPSAATESLASQSHVAHGRPQSRDPYEATPTATDDSDPFRVIFTGKGFEVSAKITSPDDADHLVQAINALKLLLRPASDFGRPRASSHAADVAADKQGIPFMITHAQKVRLRGAGVSDHDLAGMTPQEAQERLAALDE